MANLCDVVRLERAHHRERTRMDGRISPQFLSPGPGYGGPAFRRHARSAKSRREAGYGFEVLDTLIRVNEHQHKLMVEEIKQAFGGLRGKVVALLGLSFKPDTDDIRESPAIAIAKELKKGGAVVLACDPAGGCKEGTPGRS